MNENILREKLNKRFSYFLIFDISEKIYLSSILKACVILIGFTVIEFVIGETSDYEYPIS